jgi:hypothetical protein
VLCSPTCSGRTARRAGCRRRAPRTVQLGDQSGSANSTFGSAIAAWRSRAPHRPGTSRTSVRSMSMSALLPSSGSPPRSRSARRPVGKRTMICPATKSASCAAVRVERRRRQAGGAVADLERGTIRARGETEQTGQEERRRALHVGSPRDRERRRPLSAAGCVRID